LSQTSGNRIVRIIRQPAAAGPLDRQDARSIGFFGLVGNWKLTLFFVVLLWVLGALGEEIVYRGYLMNRVAGLFDNSRAAWIVSLVVVSIVFGCAHLDQGATGMSENIWDGLLLGALYLACGRNLAAPVIAHATTDTIDFVLIYLGKYPGMK
jgi:uncharacterized protein